MSTIQAVADAIHAHVRHMEGPDTNTQVISFVISAAIIDLNDENTERVAYVSIADEHTPYHSILGLAQHQLTALSRSTS